MLTGDRRLIRKVVQARQCGSLSPAVGSQPKSKPMSWQKTLILAAVSLLLSAFVTGLIAFIADHILWR
jgi:hypothetical protein